LIVLSLVLSGLVVGVAGPVTPASAAGGGVIDLTGSVPATFTVTPGVEQVTVTGGPVRAPLTLAYGDTLERIVTLYTDDLGQLTFQYVPNNFLVFDQQTDGVLPTTDGGTVRPGTYRIVSEGVPGQPFAGPVEASDAFDVLSVDDHPPTSLYDQTLPFVASKVTGGVADGHTDEEGYGYFTVRDGVKLSVNVRLPDPALYGPGPYPTVIQYSGYAPSRPGTPAGADAGGMLAGVLGFAYVGINVRGSGCSGGVFDVFNAAQAADGYDAVETVARQPWVKHGKPGMIGISYSGITQMYVAATNPPSLAAITPMSIIEDPWDQQWPGGIYNQGFTRSWLASRDDEASGGAQWVQNRIAGGDTTCAENLELRSQNIPFEAFAKSLERRPADADDRNLSIQARRITAPVHLTGAWQDEQTGDRFSVLLNDLVNVPAGKKKISVYNGHHPDGFSPLIMTRWFEFLSFYVDQTIPKVNTLVRGFSDAEFTANFGVPGNTFEPNRFYQFGTDTPIYGDYAGSLTAYEAEAAVRVLFEVGASPEFVDTYPGAHKQRFAMTFPSWPPSDATARTLYFGPGGSLVDTAPTQSEVDRFAYEPEVLGTHYFVSGDHLQPQVNNNWKVTNDGKGLAYETSPLTDQLVVAGEGHVNLWLRSTAADTPLEVVLSEVYADPDPSDGVPPEEVRVQHGLLRPAYRTLDTARSTNLLKEHLFYAGNYSPLPANQFVNVQVPLYAVAHPVRAGSRLRIEINTAGGDAPLWDFDFDDKNPATNDVALGGATPSALVLPVLPAANPFRRIPTAFADQSMHPPCDSLRGQPCRTYKALANEVVPQTQAGVSGTVTEEGSGLPAVGVTVTLMNINPSWTIAATTVTDGSGHYSFDPVPDGSYQLRFFDGQGRYQRTWYSSKQSYLHADVVTVSGGVSLPANQALPAMPTGQISGRVQSASGAGRPGISVRIYRESDGYYAGGITGADGYFLLQGVPAGNYRVQFVDATGPIPKQQWYKFKALAFNAETVVVGTGTSYASALMG
jgi:predicted acyl esterase/5-hydroxyisourate hydrolase-like protein (transthyretin family)